jgi:hypothetical protein
MRLKQTVAKPVYRALIHRRGHKAQLIATSEGYVLATLNDRGTTEGHTNVQMKNSPCRPSDARTW